MQKRKFDPEVFVKVVGSTRHLEFIKDAKHTSKKVEESQEQYDSNRTQ